MRMVHTFKTFIAPLFVAFAVMLSPLAAAAQDIVTINIQTILSESAAAKSAKTQIDSKRAQYQSELNKIEEKLRKEDQALSEQRSLLSPEALEQKRREFSKQVTEAQQSAQEKRERLGEAYNEAVGDIQDAVMKIVTDMAQKRGFKMVIPTNNIVYAAPNLDITQDVLAQLNKDLPKITIKSN